MAKAKKPGLAMDRLSKCPTGIPGLDEVTFGGLPRGRPTLVCGSAGCGKTLLGIEFLVRGATQYNEPGVCISFEETAEELAQNVGSLGFDINALISQKKLAIDYVQIERSMVEETGEYDLEALFVRLGQAVDSIGAKRVVLDSIESLFSSLENEAILRSELRRLFRWLKDRKLTAVVSGERGEGKLTRHGLEEYISDCVILLDHRVTETVFTRRLRVVKYRGSTHGTNEYPFLIDRDGISVLPVTSIDLKHAVQRRNARRNPLVGDSMIQVNRGYRQNRDTVLVDEEWILVHAVRRASVFDNAKTPGKNGFRRPVIEQDDAIGNILFQAMVRKLAFAALAGDHSSELSFFEPTKQASKFRAQNCLVREAGEQRLDTVEHYPLRSNGVDGLAKPNK